MPTRIKLFESVEKFRPQDGGRLRLPASTPPLEAQIDAWLAAQGARSGFTPDAEVAVDGYDQRRLLYFLADIKAGKMDFDVVIASPDAMRIVGTLGQILGPLCVATTAGGRADFSSGLILAATLLTVSAGLLFRRTGQS